MEDIKGTRLDPLLTVVLLVIIISFILGIGNGAEEAGIEDVLLLS
ncbi:hypothetical protein [Salipaludibacillus aurantiacus]|nr:hypothetical protein [Salipaludibacillus aurantiacus]